MPEKLAAVVITVVVLFSNGLVWAGEEMRATVKSTGFNRLQVIEYGHWSQEEVKVDSDTVYTGVDSLNDFSAGDEILITYDVVNQAKEARFIKKISRTDAAPEQLFQPPVADKEQE